MGNNLVNLGQTTKEQLETIRDTNDHKSLDSVVRTLLKDHELATVYRTLHTDDLPTEDPLEYEALTPDPYDPTATDWTQNRLYAGAIGSGKKAVVTEDLTTVLQQPDAPRVIYLDPFGDAEFHRVAEPTNASVERLTAGDTDDINPLFATALDEDAHAHSKVNDAVWALRELLALPALPEETPDPADADVEAVLRTAVERMYEAQSDGPVWPTLVDVTAHVADLADDGVAGADAVHGAFQMLTQGGGGVFTEGENLLAETDADVLNVSCGTESALEMVAAFVYFAECARASDDAFTVVVRDTQGLDLTDADAAGWENVETHARHARHHGLSFWVEVQAWSSVPDGVAEEQFPVRHLFKSGLSDGQPSAFGRAEREFLRNASVIPINEGDEGVVEFLTRGPTTGGAWTPHYAQL